MSLHDIPLDSGEVFLPFPVSLKGNIRASLRSIAVFAVLQEANEKVNIYDGGHSYIDLYSLPIVLDDAEDWLAWMRHLFMLTCINRWRRTKKPLFDQACFWEDAAALLRKFALELMDLGVEPTAIEWNEKFNGKNT